MSTNDPELLTYTEAEFDELKLSLSKALNALSRKQAAYFIWVSAASSDHPGMAISACRTNLPTGSWEEVRPSIIEHINEHKSDPGDPPADTIAALRELLVEIEKKSGG